MLKRSILKSILVIFIIFLFISCAPEEEAKIEVIGDWVETYSRVVVTETTITNYSRMSEADDWSEAWVASIIEFNNDKFNSDETCEGDCGFAVIKYTTASAYQPTSQDKFNILRWKNLSSPTMEYSEGYKDSTGPSDTDYTGTYFDTADDAKSGATDTAGFFAAYSEVNKQ
jgi:hypothetical protein